MNRIEQIKAEIERRNLANYCGTAEQYEEELFTILDTLPEEKPSEDLEKAADSHIYKIIDTVGHPGWDWEKQDVVDAFIAGANWQKEQMVKDAVETIMWEGDLLNPIFVKRKVIVVKEDEK